MHLLAPYQQSPFLDAAVLGRYESVGGIRIEDNILITENGAENLTWSEARRHGSNQYVQEKIEPLGMLVVKGLIFSRDGHPDVSLSILIF